MDDEKVAYLGYEKFVKAGIKNVCVHKGLFAPPLDRQFPNLRPFADASDVGQAAKDWPQLNFIIYHAAYRHVGGDPKVALAEFESTGRISWTSDLADIPDAIQRQQCLWRCRSALRHDLVAEPRVTAALMGNMIKEMGADRVCWGTDAVWTGSPQWQIEGLRRFEIPEDMQKKYGFAPLGPATGPVKSAIFGGNNARLYGIEPKKAELELQERQAHGAESQIRQGRPRAEQSALRLCRGAGLRLFGIRVILHGADCAPRPPRFAWSSSRALASQGRWAADPLRTHAQRGRGPARRAAAPRICATLMSGPVSDF